MCPAQERVTAMFNGVPPQPSWSRRITNQLQNKGSLNNTWGTTT